MERKNRNPIARHAWKCNRRVVHNMKHKDPKITRRQVIRVSDCYEDM